MPSLEDARRYTDDGLRYTLPRDWTPLENGHQGCRACGRLASEWHLGPDGRRWAIALPMGAGSYRKGQKWQCRICSGDVEGADPGHAMPD